MSLVEKSQKIEPSNGQNNTHLKLLSFNIQVGIATSRYRHYLTQSWKHVLPHAKCFENLDRIAQLSRHFDIVALQEVDSGSFRSNFVNQIEYLANKAHFPFWYNQVNRNLGKLAQHSNGLLSRIKPDKITEHKLPGLLPGRGVMEVRYGSVKDPLVLLLIHLGLGKNARVRQLEYIASLVNQYEHVIVMGDFNCQAISHEIDTLIQQTHLCEPADDLLTFPSWRPLKNIDHILVSPSIKIHKIEVIRETMSDHLPIMVDILVPNCVAKRWHEQNIDSEKKKTIGAP